MSADSSADCSTVESTLAPPPGPKVNKETVKALKADRFSYINRTSARLQKQSEKMEESLHVEEQQPFLRKRRIPHVDAEAIENLSDAQKHQETFDTVSERHTGAKNRLEKCIVTEKFFVDDIPVDDEEEDEDEGGKSLANERTLKQRQVDYLRGQMICNPVVSSVMLQCAEEGVSLQPKHHPVSWTMPKKKKVENEWSPQNNTSRDIKELDTQTENNELNQNSSEVYAKSDDLHQENNEVGVESNDSQENVNRTRANSAEHSRPHTSGATHRSTTDINRKPKGQVSPRQPKSGGERHERERLMEDLKKLKEKRLKVNLANKNAGLYDATLSKSGARLKNAYERRFNRLANLIKKCEECKENTKRIRARGLLRDELIEDLAIEEELNSQREMILTKQQYLDDPLWRRPDPPSVPVPSKLSRPRSATGSNIKHNRRLINRNTPQERGINESVSSQKELEESKGHVPQSPPLPFKRHQNQIRWHQGPKMGKSNVVDNVSNKSNTPILPVSMAAINARAREMESYSSGDESDDTDEEVKETDTDQSNADVNGNVGNVYDQNFPVKEPADVPRPKSAPSSSAINNRCFGHKHEQSDKSKKAHGNKDEVSESSSTSDDDIADGDDDKLENIQVVAPTRYRHKRQALMGPRAQVANDNKNIELHKTQLGLEIDDFMDVYGKDVFKVDYSGASREKSGTFTNQRQAFTIISSHLLQASIKERREKSKNGKVDDATEVKAEELAQDTLDIMGLFLQGMKSRHEKIQMENNMTGDGGEDKEDSTAKETLMESYNLYWKKKRGIVDEKPSTATTNVIDESPKEKKPPDDESNEQEDMVKKLRNQFNAERMTLLEGRKQATKEKKEQHKRNVQLWLEQKMGELMGTLDLNSSEAQRVKETKMMSVEISLLFSGFQKLDISQDGLLSPTDVVKVCKEFNVNLCGKDVSAIMWLMDDNRRGKLTFDDVMKFYTRNRNEFLQSGITFHLMDEEARKSEEAKNKRETEKKVIQTGFGVFGVENEAAKRRTLDGGSMDMFSPVKRQTKSRESLRKKQAIKRQRSNTSADMQQLTVTAGDLRSQPLLLFRILFFLAMQNKTGEIHLMSAFQSLCQLFGSKVAEEKFNCIFLRRISDLQDSDRITLSEFVEHMKQQKLAVKKYRLQVKSFK